MNLRPLKLNNIERVVHGGEPTELFSGFYSVDTNNQGSLERLDRQSLFDILAEEGLDYSGVDHETQHGFNDHNVLGVEEAKTAKSNGKSYIWIGLDNRGVFLEVLPKTFKELGEESHLEYAQRILEHVVTFVETSDNYQK